MTKIDHKFETHKADAHHGAKRGNGTAVEGALLFGDLFGETAQPEAEVVKVSLATNDQDSNKRFNKTIDIQSILENTPKDSLDYIGFDTEKVSETNLLSENGPIDGVLPIAVDFAVPILPPPLEGKNAEALAISVATHAAAMLQTGPPTTSADVDVDVDVDVDPKNSFALNPQAFIVASEALPVTTGSVPLNQEEPVSTAPAGKVFAASAELIQKQALDSKPKIAVDGTPLEAFQGALKLDKPIPSLSQKMLDGEQKSQPALSKPELATGPTQIKITEAPNEANNAFDKAQENSALEKILSVKDANTALNQSNMKSTTAVTNNLTAGGQGIGQSSGAAAQSISGSMSSALGNSTAGPATTAAAQVLQTLDTRRIEWGTRLISKIDSLRADGKLGLELSLRPKNLGVLHIRLEIGTDTTSVGIQTETLAAAHLLNASKADLSQLMQDQGFKLSNLSTFVGGQGHGSESQNNRQSGQGKGSTNKSIININQKTQIELNGIETQSGGRSLINVIA